jgi:FkbM family methyltransferase
MKITYGTNEQQIDITEICMTKLMYNDIITIPYNDVNRAIIFSDPLFGVLKKIFVSFDENHIQVYEDYYIIKINVKTQIITTLDINQQNRELDVKLKKIHSTLQIKYGTFQEEYPEQKMVVQYLTGHEKVLEIGANIGRNSLIIASILENKQNFLTLECDTNIAKQLQENRDLNSFDFHIEKSALSKRKLIQKDWDTMPSDVLLDGYKWVDTITLDELRIKYPIKFDTLVLDCEGAFYYILQDMPAIMDNIQLIIMENDYHEISKKQYVDEILTKHGFYVDYTESGGWGCCANHFFEVWKKAI